MVDLTVLILTKNEEHNLRKCVESFRGVAKRFVVIDSFSTDGTKKLAQELNEELQKQGSRLDFMKTSGSIMLPSLIGGWKIHLLQHRGRCAWMRMKNCWKNLLVKLTAVWKNCRRKFQE